MAATDDWDLELRDAARRQRCAPEAGSRVEWSLWFGAQRGVSCLDGSKMKKEKATLRGSSGPSGVGPMVWDVCPSTHRSCTEYCIYRTFEGLRQFFVGMCSESNWFCRALPPNPTGFTHGTATGFCISYRDGQSSPLFKRY